MSENIVNHSKAGPQTSAEEPLSEAEREQIIGYVISTQMIEGFELDDDRAGQLIDIAYAQQIPTLE